VDSAVVFQEESVPQEAGKMTNAKKLFTKANLEQLHQRITDLEKRTDAEVVCAVATESDRYDRAECICGLLLGLLALITGSKIAATGTWDATGTIPVGMQVALMVGGFIGGTVLASYWHPLRRLFVSDRHRELAVHRCVHYVFSREGIGSKRNRGGLLIYLSLFEHRLEIHCDEAVAGRIPAEKLEALRDAVLNRVAKGEFTEGLLDGLDLAEKLLTEALPSSGDTAGELPNELLLFHPRP